MERVPVASSLLVCFLSAATGAAVGNGQTTNGLSFAGFPGPYSFQMATSVDYNNGNPSCPMGKANTDDGPLAPLTSEMHHIFRGPLNLLQFAVYQPQVSNSNAQKKSSDEHKAHFHHHRYGRKRRHYHRNPRVEKRDAVAAPEQPMVTTTIDGQVATFPDTWDSIPGAVETVTDEVAGTSTNAKPTSSPSVVKSEGSYEAAADPSPSAAQPSAPASAPSGSWSRVGYFNAGSQTSDGVAFTANNNMTIEAFGFLPGHVAPNGRDKANEASILSASGFIPDNHEVLVHSSSLCSSGDSSGGCGVVTPGAVAYHGWANERIILAEYKMPQSRCGSSCANQFTGNSANTNAPAWWSLSSSTINIGQYGFSFSSDCSGWSSGAGELDIHEILPGGNEPFSIGYASLHMDKHYSGTPPQGFPRPDGDSSMKMAVIIAGDKLRIQVLGSQTQFGSSFDADLMEAWINGNVSSSSSTGRTGGQGFVNMLWGGAPSYNASTDLVDFNVIVGA